MATYGNNTKQEYASVRDCFFDSSEKTYFTLVLALSDEERQKHEEYKKVDAVHLYNHAKMLMEQVENGEVPDDKMDYVEMEIAHCLGAIEDIQMEMELER
jgi:hypothetical protein